ncbi:HalOD1 output domain-containing protein [Halorubrum lacusprofundi]|jgi:hypothetical protein|uniref:Halobacterial output domain-containing protein n=1 Tax=Halorubrum lacusprofundi (strain ATCC 49239 / DSM 5036 / JCM 8891 / ACAM 34) TaxID=416348 RepID=B9LU49_HALLT|nr:HalOD1 output domain-containing protein [Halorubrum lacusprofundi]ACM58243.1 hypothetical protein Hlac_2672 [Halorubrum lacusprofundi ATCC 49239]MCG1006325.1 hypothetical protein [Halorubrum lacusprofundi]
MSSVTAESGGHEAISETVRVEHGDADLSPSRAVIEAVAGAAGVDPVDLADEAGVVLYDYVDLDALDTLVAGHSGSGVDISLSVAGYEVSVDATAAVAERTR